MDKTKVWKPREATLLQSNKIYSSIMEDTGAMEDVNESSRTEVDSHVNMPVIGMNAYILSTIGETVDVAPFTPDDKPIRVELVDAALKYECPYSGEIKILIIRRGFHVPSMTNNLLPPFMLREAGITINEVPKLMYPHQQRSIMQLYSKKPFVIVWHILLFSHKQANYQGTGRTRGCI